jgi:ATP-binding cassette, subfamily C, bacterial LapB
VTDRIIPFDRAAPRPPVPAPPRGRRQNRAQARAEIASVYAAVLGAQVPPADLMEHIQLAAGSGKLGLDEVAVALRAAGLTAEVVTRKAEPALWPALAGMTSGQIVLVLNQADGLLEIWDPTTPDLRAEVAEADFLAVYAGRAVKARTTLADLEARHGEAGTGPHWFWGEFAQHRRALAKLRRGRWSPTCWRCRSRCFRCRSMTA